MMTRLHAPKGVRSLGDFHAIWRHMAPARDDLSALAHEALSHLYAVDEPQVEWVEKEEAYWLSTELAGMHQDDITIRVDEGMLFLQGEWPEEKPAGEIAHPVRPCRAFARQFALPEPVEMDTISTMCRDGVLTVCIRKATHPETAHRVAQTA